MGRLRAYAVDVLIAAGFLILPLLLFGAVTFGDRTMVPVDNLFQWQPWSAAAEEVSTPYPHNTLLSDLILENYPWKRFINESVSTGEIPLWNPNIFAGTPFLATGQHSAYYPFSLLFMILPLIKAYGWFTVGQLWLAGVFTYLFGRVLGQRRASAAAAGLIFQGSGFLLVSSAVFPMILAAAVWLPLLLACIEKVIRNAVHIAREIGPTYLQLYTPCILEIGKNSMEGLQEMRDSAKPTERFAYKEYVSEPAKQLLAELSAKDKERKAAAKQLAGQASA